jgi:DcuC family C4-dicarboxylate transporter
MLGLHPIVTVKIFVTSIEPQSLGFSPEYFAVLLLASWGIGNTVSPASAVNHLISNFWNLDVTDVSYKWNFKYVIAMSLLLPVYLMLIK